MEITTTSIKYSNYLDGPRGVHLSHFRKILRIDFRKMQTAYLRI